MKKRNIFITVAVLLAVILIIIFVYFFTKGKSYYGYSFCSGTIESLKAINYDDDMQKWRIGEKSNIIKTYSELQEFCAEYDDYTYHNDVRTASGKLNPLLARYNRNFFENQNLAIAYVELGTGSDIVKFIKAKRVGNSVKIKYTIEGPPTGPCTYIGYLLVAEVDKDITNIIGKRV